MAIGNQGDSRNNATIEWSGQSSSDWNLQVNSINTKWQDGDGSGTVDANDVAILNKNYNCLHNNTPQPIMAHCSDYYYDVAIAIEGNNTLKIEIKIRKSSGSVSLHGFACSIDLSSLDSNISNIQSVTTDFESSCMGLKHIVEKYNPDNRILDIGMSREEITNVLCEDILITAIVILDDVATFQAIPIDIKDGLSSKVDDEMLRIANATYVKSNDLEGLINISTMTTHRAFGNMGKTTIEVDGGVAPYNLTVHKLLGTNTTGEQVYTGTVDNQNLFTTIENLDTGNYMITVEDNQQHTNTRSITILETSYGCIDESAYCPPHVVLGTVIENGAYRSIEDSTTDGIIESGNKVSLISTRSILLEAGFRMEEETELEIKIEACEGN